ncbi:Putative teichuronic acid biosynthesis glycosyltransferase TuaH [Bacillus sp. THAF10]|uniref:glycosyltransferase n=1 Tax=Bacillus sp. THAF10 TaxID=2587848 RepID=UPI0012680AD2|nr:glycosyltransferase [Bacillus sp. THAF10]QFT88406.1 Putative teichuronic acid biosynthesis glycosyltransferase TuaH [Bacillus sp. THAF10]
MTIIIYPPTIDWTFMRQRPQHLMSQFAQDHHTVLYFNKENQSGMVWNEVEKNLFTINHAQFFIDQILPSLNDNKLFWTSWSKKIPFAKQCRADYIVYDCVDDFPEWDMDEKRWIHKVDAIICTATNLMDKMKKIAPKTPKLLAPNGCDWEFFYSSQSLNTKVLEGVPTTAGPKIGYIGAWAPWVDKEIISKLADTYPQGQIIIIGPLLSTEMISKNNVHYLGYRDYHELPVLISYFDTCIIPFKINRITQSTNPIKVYEYLAAGKPVVSTDLPEVRNLTPFVHIAKDHNQFLSMVDNSIVSNSNPSTLSKFAKQFSWTERYKDIYHSLVNSYPLLTKNNNNSKLLQSFSYLNETYALNHCTTNSYYATTNLKNDPPFIGTKPSGEYHCFLLSPKEVVNMKAEYYYLDIDVNNSEQFNTLHLEIKYTKELIDINTLSYSNTLCLHSYKHVHLSESINSTFSVNITDLVINLGYIPSFRLASKNPSHIRFSNPKLSVFKRIKDEVSL